MPIGYLADYQMLVRTRRGILGIQPLCICLKFLTYRPLVFSRIAMTAENNYQMSYCEIQKLMFRVIHACKFIQERFYLQIGQLPTGFGRSVQVEISIENCLCLRSRKNSLVSKAINFAIDELCYR